MYHDVFVYLMVQALLCLLRCRSCVNRSSSSLFLLCLLRCLLRCRYCINRSSSSLFLLSTLSRSRSKHSSSSLFLLCLPRCHSYSNPCSFLSLPYLSSSSLTTTRGRGCLEDLLKFEGKKHQPRVLRDATMTNL